MVIEEEGKLYNIDEATGLVTLAATTEAGLEDAPEATFWNPEFEGGERVEVDGKFAGNVVAVTQSVYGPAVAVRDDDGRVEEYPADRVRLTNTALKPEDSLEQIKKDFSVFEGVPAITSAEIEHKTERAKRLLADVRTVILRTSSVGDVAVLDRIAFQLESELKDFEQNIELARSAESTEYLDGMPRYKMADNFSAPAPNMGISSSAADTSWLGAEDDDYLYAETTEADMAARAAETVAQFDRTQLENDSFVHDATSFQATYLGIHEDPAKRAKFASFVEAARRNKLAEPIKETKVAAAEDDIADFDPATLFV